MLNPQTWSRTSFAVAYVMYWGSSEKTVLDICLPSISSSPRSYKLLTDRFTVFQMCVVHHQMLNTCIPCLELPLTWGADSHTGTLCGQTIPPLSVFLHRQHSSLLQLLLRTALPTPPLMQEHRKMSREQGQGKRKEKEVVSVLPREK